MKRTVAIASLIFALILASCGWIVRESSDDSLSTLEISSGTLNPEFSAEELNYTATVTTNSITLNAITTHSYAVVLMKVNAEGYSIIPQNEDIEVLLNMGENTILLKVVAEDGGANQTYKIIVTRGLASNPNLGPATLTALTDTNLIVSIGDWGQSLEISKQ